MTVDISKIKPGDKILVELIVAHIRDKYIIAGTKELPTQNSILSETIVKHIPKPHELKVGDRYLVYSSNDISSKYVYEIIALTDEWVFSKCEHGSQRPYIHNKEELLKTIKIL